MKRTPPERMTREVAVICPEPGCKREFNVNPNRTKQTCPYCGRRFALSVSATPIHPDHGREGGLIDSLFRMKEKHFGGR